MYPILNTIHGVSRAAATYVDSLEQNKTPSRITSLIKAQEYEFAVKTYGNENTLIEKDKSTASNIATYIGRAILLRTSPLTDQKTDACLDNLENILPRDIVENSTCKKTAQKKNLGIGNRSNSHKFKSRH